MAWLSLDGRWLRRGCAWVELRHAVGSEVAVALGMARGLYLTTIECVAVGCRICETVCGCRGLCSRGGQLSDYIGW